MSLAIELATDLAEDFEGLSLTPYHDPVGFPTIGYGRLLSREPWADLSRWEPIDAGLARAWLEEDMARATQSVARLITADLPAEQEAALIDFVFNCGAGNLQASTLRRVVNRGDYDAAPAQLQRWVYARGVKLPGLVRRREAEVALWMRC